jgi:putative endonuclease
MAGLFGFLRRDAGGRGSETARQRTGRRGERVAERYLKRHGYRILARNVTYRQGEVDLVVREKASGTVCFVEVRSRRLGAGEDAVVEPEATVTGRKRRRIVSAAKTFLAKRRAGGEAVRFDVVTVRFAADGRGRPDVRHYPGAFDAQGNLL